MISEINTILNCNKLDYPVYGSSFRFRIEGNTIWRSADRKPSEVMVKFRSGYETKSPSKEFLSKIKYCT